MPQPPEPRPAVRVPKLCGADVELGNFILGVGRTDTGPEASRALLREIDGVASYSYSPYAWGASAAPAAKRWDPQDVGRKFLPANGGCVYIDLDHLELCVPEVRSAHDHVAAWHAMLRVARAALDAANERLPEGVRVQVLINNSDGLSHSYGSHTNFLVTRKAWDDIFHRKLHFQLFLAACQASSIVFTGQGKVGSENGAAPVAYQIAQRADFFETLSGSQTTFERPIVNSRDESLCGGGRGGLARLHCIFFDSTLCQVATLLKIGVMQIVLAMIESEEVDTRLLLDDPVAAVRVWSHDPCLGARARLLSGKEVTAVELQLCLFERAERFASRGGCKGVVPRAAEILRLWEDTLRKLEAKDFDALAGRLDWVLKRRILERAMTCRRELDWGSPSMKHLDHLYSSLAAGEGLYWAYERQGAVEKVVADEAIDHFVGHAPSDTRAYTRAMLLRAAGERASRVDWDSITFDGLGGPRSRLVLEMANPLRFGRAELERHRREGHSLGELLIALGAESERYAEVRGARYEVRGDSR
jgi:proteasome accessory factor A